jgi:hypothetical protein
MPNTPKGVGNFHPLNNTFGVFTSRTNTNNLIFILNRFYNEVPVMNKPANYRIKVRGRVPESWIDRLGGMRVVTVSSTLTTLEGRLSDQAALKGVLDTLYELRLCLREVSCL